LVSPIVPYYFEVDGVRIKPSLWGNLLYTWFSPKAIIDEIFNFLPEGSETGGLKFELNYSAKVCLENEDIYIEFNLELVMKGYPLAVVVDRILKKEQEKIRKFNLIPTNNFTAKNNTDRIIINEINKINQDAISEALKIINTPFEAMKETIILANTTQKNKSIIKYTLLCITNKYFNIILFNFIIFNFIINSFYKIINTILDKTLIFIPIGII
jgi:hypothetical protein